MDPLNQPMKFVYTQGKFMKISLKITSNNSLVLEVSLVRTAFQGLWVDHGYTAINNEFHHND